jgi:hypothetical protein
MLWDGEQLIDASAGYPDNETLVAELLGFRPTRHAPLGTVSTLYAAPEAPGALGGEPDDEDDDAEPV